MRMSRSSLNYILGIRATLLSLLLLFASALARFQVASAVDGPSYVTSEAGEGRFALSAAGQSAPLYVSADDYAGVIRAANALQSDIGRVTGTEPTLATEGRPASTMMVLIGTLGKSPIIDRLVRERKLKAAGVAGRWETFVLQVVDDPCPGVEQALVIAGSDKRGTIYGMYDLSEAIGVSPWHWWADVPVPHRSNLYVRPGRHTEGPPAVKYRGLFINDENPALLGWVNATFGGFNHRFYTKVFELLLRMKANYLWPAMWGKSFFDDDSLNHKLADTYGIVIGTSHHEPMMRAHVEWERYGHGPWNYRTNADTLRKFWRTGIERMDEYESLVTVGMRGDGDKPMTEGTAIHLLETIVGDQRQILKEVTGKDPAEIPQVWALYKEVQQYYDQGMRVPEDVTLLFADDNWGNIRRLPALDSTRAGGYGIYYHFDYVGGPRSYKWINTSQIERVWEQMHLAHRYGTNRIWIANVGDIKPMEFPITFFLNYAWNPDDWPVERLPAYTRLWAKQQFGREHAAAIADLLSTYTKYNSRRKPELLSPDTYSLVNYREAERVAAHYTALADRAERMYNDLPPEYRAAFYQLVLYPVKASANLNEMYVTVAKNRLYATQGRAATNTLADSARALFERDAELTRHYHKEMAGGKWNHMMSQAHVGDSGSWRAPRENTLPEVKEIKLPAGAEMGVAIEGSKHWWPKTNSAAVLPALTPYGKPTAYIEVFNRGQAPFDYTVESGAAWLHVTPEPRRLDEQQRLQVRADWSQAPPGRHRVPITIMGPDGNRVTVHAEVFNPAPPKRNQRTGFIESNGYVSMEATHYTRAVNAAPMEWQRIPNLGRTGSAMTPVPVTADAQKPGGDSPHLEYRFHLFTSGNVIIRAYLSPTLDFRNTGGLRYAVSIDDGPPTIVNIHAAPSHRAWQKWVSNNINIMASRHSIDEPGEHVLKFWMVDPGVVLQKLVIDTGGVKPSYLGPPESSYRTANVNP